MLKHLAYFVLTFCLLETRAQQPITHWVRAQGSNQNENAHAVAVDANENTYITGGFEGTVDFDPGVGNSTLSPSGNDIFVVKYDSEGEFVWVRRMGGSGNDHGRSIITDNQGNIYVSGYFSSTCDFDPGPNTHQKISMGGMDFFLLKLNSSGDFQWVVTKGGSGTDIGYDQAIASNGNIVYTGAYTNSSLDVLFGAISPAGDEIWSHTIGASDWDNGYDINTDNAEHIYVSGKFVYTVDFDPSANTHTSASEGSIDSFIATYDNDGNYLNHTTIGGAGDDYVFTAVNDDGDIFFCGHSDNTIEFGSGQDSELFDPISGTDIFYGRYDTSFNLIWMKQAGGTGNDKGQWINYTTTGDLVMIGPFRTSLDFDVNMTTDDCISNGNDDCYVCKLHPDGEIIWATSFGSNLGDWPYSAATTDEEILVTGWVAANTTWEEQDGQHTYISQGGKDIFTIKIGETLPVLTSSQSFEICPGESITVGSSEYTQSGVYTDVLTSAAGIDSIITTTITLLELPLISISTNGNELSCDLIGSSYQWFECGNGYNEIEGATNQEYSPNVEGMYAVAITGLQCPDTSVCYPFSFCTPVVFDQNIVLCKGQSVTVGISTYTEEGNYVDILESIGGCDSIVNTSVIENPEINLNVLTGTNVLYAEQANASYQWLDCANGYMEITGATNQYFQAIEDGVYAVVIGLGVCSDTSNCQNLTLIQVNETQNEEAFILAPNPAQTTIVIQSQSNCILEIHNMLGEVVHSGTITIGSNQIDIQKLRNGLYQAHCVSDKNRWIMPFVVSR
jgi:hypothetical protein